MLLVALAALVGSALQSATGFGFALVASPLLFAVLDPGDALTTLVVLSAALSALVLASERRKRHVLGRPLAGVLVASLPGLVLGALILTAVDKRPLQVAVGVVVVLAVLIQIQAGSSAGGSGAQPPPAWETAVAGAVTGVLSTTTSISGPPLLIWLERMGATPDETRDTLAAAFIALTPPFALSLAAFGELGVGGVGAGWLALLLVPVALGRALGRRVFMRLDPARFRRAGLVLAVLAGVTSVVAGLAG